MRTPTLVSARQGARRGRARQCLLAVMVGLLWLAGCSDAGPPAPSSVPQPAPEASASASGAEGGYALVDADTRLVDVVNHPAFGRFGRFLVPNGGGLPDDGRTLRDVGDLLPYHRHVDVGTSVDVVNALIAAVDRGQPVFHDIYPDAARAADPSRQDTGLFYFEGEPGAPFAIISAGGGFSYVGSLHESLPHALELSRRGYHAFALQYRTGGLQVAAEDLAAALSYVFAHADELGLDTSGYSLWGGSAGARMAATLGAWGPAAFGGDQLPRPAAVIMQYTGYADVSGQDPPTYACVGEDDGIASWRTMQRRVDALAAAGVPTEFHRYPNLGHGFGLGIGTSAEGWIDSAVAFWEQHR